MISFFFFFHRGKSLSCIGAKRNLSNPAGLIEFCSCDYNLNASKITLKGVLSDSCNITRLALIKSLRVHINTGSDARRERWKREGEGSAEAEQRVKRSEREKGDGGTDGEMKESGDSCQLCDLGGESEPALSALLFLLSAVICSSLT